MVRPPFAKHGDDTTGGWQTAVWEANGSKWACEEYSWACEGAYEGACEGGRDLESEGGEERRGDGLHPAGDGACPQWDELPSGG